MTRMIITSLLSFIDANIPNNSTQLITPQKVRDCLKNVTDSTTTVLAALSGTSAGLAVPLTTTASKIPGSFFTTSFVGNPSWLDASPAPNGTIIVNNAIGRLRLSLDLAFTAPSGQNIAFTFAKNGVLVPSRTVVTAQGAGNPVAGAFSWMIPALVAGDVFDVWAQMLAGSTTITLTNGVVQGTLFPQYS